MTDNVHIYNFNAKRNYKFGITGNIVDNLVEFKPKQIKNSFVDIDVDIYNTSINISPKNNGKMIINVKFNVLYLSSKPNDLILISVFENPRENKKLHVFSLDTKASIINGILTTKLAEKYDVNIVKDKNYTFEIKIIADYYKAVQISDYAVELSFL
ncbi:MAG: hypothetical protein QW478_01720 [Candidatus Micrarchaeaceae archaeon]